MVRGENCVFYLDLIVDELRNSWFYLYDVDVVVLVCQYCYCGIYILVVLVDYVDQCLDCFFGCFCLNYGPLFIDCCREQRCVGYAG